MIDIEQKIYEDGFTRGEVNESGDFHDEGHEDIKWQYHVAEVEIDLSSLSSICGTAGEGGADEADDSSTEESSDSSTESSASAQE